MNTSDIARFEKRLQDEKIELEKQLSTIGTRDSSSPGGWDATSGTLETDSADENETADKFEELSDNNAIVTNLETQLGEVKAALERIKEGKYGICEATGEPIEMERLEANPSSRFSIKHVAK